MNAGSRKAPPLWPLLFMGFCEGGFMAGITLCSPIRHHRLHEILASFADCLDCVAQADQTNGEGLCPDTLAPRDDSHVIIRNVKFELLNSV